jgi:hypothetical protein
MIALAEKPSCVFEMPFLYSPVQDLATDDDQAKADRDCFLTHHYLLVLPLEYESGVITSMFLITYHGKVF